jgi:hypothetical protein
MDVKFLRPTMDALKHKYQPGMMGNRISVRRQQPLAPNVEDDGYVLTNVLARITAGYGTFRDVADRFSGITPYTISCPLGTDIRPGDYIVDEEGVTYHVRDVRDHGTFEAVVNALCDWVH